MSESKKIEWVKLIVDLIGMLSYPIVILVLVFYIVDNAQFHALLDKLTGAKIGNTEFTFQAIEDKAADEALLNSEILELKRKTDKLEKELQVLLKKNPKVLKIIEKESKDYIDSQKLIVANSKYSVLVFNKPSQIVIANLILDFLLKSGYTASRTTTDLSELSNTLPTGTLFITRNQDGDKVVDQIISNLKELYPELKIHKQKSIQPLRRGDVQISLF